MSQQQQGISLIEQGLSSVIFEQCKPEIKKLKEEVKETKKSFQPVKKEIDERLQKAEKLVDEKVLHSETETSEKINALMKRIQYLEKTISNEVNLHVKERGKEEGDQITFPIPQEGIKEIYYTIGGKENIGTFKNDLIQGNHIKCSKKIHEKFTIELDKKLDKNTTLTIKTNKPNFEERIQNIEYKIEKSSNDITAIKNMLKKVGDYMTKIDSEE